MRKMLIISATIGIMFLMIGIQSVFSEGKGDLKLQSTCPIMGGSIDKTQFADHEGCRVYFCCSGCMQKFKASPAEFLKIINEKGEKPYEIQKTDPLTNQKFDKTIFSDYQGFRVYFSSEESKKKFDMEPVGIMKKSEEAGIVFSKKTS